MARKDGVNSTVTVLDSTSAFAMSAVHHAAFTAGWSGDAFVDLMAAPHTVALGVVVEGSVDGAGDTLTGFILLSVAADEAEILTLAVMPDTRRRGLASRLLEQAIVRARAGGAMALFLEVSETNAPALGLYEGAGFIETGRRPGYYRSEDGADALIMKLKFPT